MSVAAGLETAAAVFLGGFLALGYYVSSRALGRADARAVWFRGQATRIALVFTVSGRSRALVFVYVLCYGVFLAARLPLCIPLFLALTQILSQTAVELAKRLYRRTRPDYWIVGQDAGHSYPSGHATTAVVTYLGWAVVIAATGLAAPFKIGLDAILVVWAIGIGWSRLALGAHYLSDVAGGVLLGAGWECVVILALVMTRCLNGV